MVIDRLALNRRTFLRGMGATIALPLLDAMVPALTAQSRSAAATKLRLACIYVPHGAIMEQWTPQTVGADFDFSRVLKPLEPFREYVTVISGLAERNIGTAHLTASAMWLNGVNPKKTEGSDIESGTTLDQYVAAHIGSDTQLTSIEWATEDMGGSIGSCDGGYSCLYQNTVSWKNPTTPLPVEINPRALFERVFGEGGTSAQRLARIQLQRSLLDEVADEARRLQARLGQQDRTRLGEYLDNIREVEQRIQKAEQQTANNIELPDAPPGIPDTFEEHVQLMMDLALLAWQADITRVWTGMLGVEATFRSYPEIGVADGHHFVSHNGGQAERIDKHAKINVFHYMQIAKLVEKMKAIPDGDGTLLDHSLILYGSGMGDANIHRRDNIPAVVIGGAGGHKGNKHVQYPQFTPLTNLHVAIAEKFGLELQKLGDSNGKVDL